MSRIPLDDLSGPHGHDVIGPGYFRVQGRIHRNNSNAALVHHGHDHVMDEGSGRLVNIGLHSQTVVQTAVNSRNKAAIVIQLHMLNVNSRRIQRDSIEYRRDDGTFVSTGQPGPVRTIGVASSETLVVAACGLSAEERVPRVLQSRAKGDFHALLPSLSQSRDFRTTTSGP